MLRRRPGILAALIAVTLPVVVACGLSACSGSAGSDEEQPPATVEEVGAGQPSRVILTARAAERLGIETAAVQTAVGSAKLTVPYSAVLYDADGNAWTFTNPEPLVFVRAPMTVEKIQGDTAVLSSGPPAGTLVVTVGAAELFGTELGVGHE